jgi:hypothetical protein
MLRDGKRQAGAVGFFRRRSITPVPELSLTPRGSIATTALEVFYDGKTVRLN